VLADRESEPGPPRETEEMGSLDIQRVEDRHGICGSQGERVRTHLAWLVAAALPAVIGEDQVNVGPDGAGQAGRLLPLKWIGKLRVRDDRRPIVGRVLEIRSDTTDAVLWREASLSRGRPTPRRRPG
jgi:hypothetical protein